MQVMQKKKCKKANKPVTVQKKKPVGKENSNLVGCILPLMYPHLKHL
jgi:hypothetical protein